jgi:acetylornithine deacetylase
MDSLATVAFARQLIDIDSTDRERAGGGAWLGDRSRPSVIRSEQQPVADGRFNVFATLDRPLVGALDALRLRAAVLSERRARRRALRPRRLRREGILAAQLAAAERLRAAGERRIGLLFVVGEERGSDGAVVANAKAPAPCF